MKRGVKVTVIATYHPLYGKQGVVIGGVKNRDGIEYLIGLTTGETVTVGGHEIQETSKGRANP
jgi:hypothetical protein